MKGQNRGLYGALLRAQEVLQDRNGIITMNDMVPLLVADGVRIGEKPTVQNVGTEGDNIVEHGSKEDDEMDCDNEEELGAEEQAQRDSATDESNSATQPVEPIAKRVKPITKTAKQVTKPNEQGFYPMETTSAQVGGRTLDKFWGCKLCPEEKFDREDTTNPRFVKRSARYHVETEHAGRRAEDLIYLKGKIAREKKKQ